MFFRLFPCFQTRSHNTFPGSLALGSRLIAITLHILALNLRLFAIFLRH